MRKHTNEEFLNWLCENRPDLEILEIYVNGRTRTEFKCAQNHIWKTSPISIKTGRGCPFCANNLKLTNEKINESLFHHGVTIVGDYINKYTTVEFQCSSGHSFTGLLKNVRIQGCRICNPPTKKKRILTTKEIVNDELKDRNITMLDDYVSARTVSRFKCEYDHVWNASLNNIKQGTSCPICVADNRRRDIKTINDELSSRNISLIGDYVNNKTKTKFSCQNGHQWNATPGSVLNSKSGCPECSIHGFDITKPAWFYVFKRDNYIKFGISHDANRRLQEHSKHGKLETLISEYFEMGKDALNFENKIKETYGGKYVTKEQCPDGWTETLPIEFISEITTMLQSLKEQGAKK